MRALLDETALEKGLQTATAYFDLDKFYDSTSLTKLAQMAIQVDCPIVSLRFSVQVCRQQVYPGRGVHTPVPRSC